MYRQEHHATRSNLNERNELEHPEVLRKMVDESHKDEKLQEIDCEFIHESDLLDSGTFSVRGYSAYGAHISFYGEVIEATKNPDFADIQIQSIMNNVLATVKKVRYKDCKETYEVGYCINGRYTKLGIFKPLYSRY